MTATFFIVISPFNWLPRFETGEKASGCLGTDSLTEHIQWFLGMLRP